MDAMSKLDECNCNTLYLDIMLISIPFLNILDYFYLSFARTLL